MDGVIFDMDGVLCDSEPFIREAACLMFAERYGVQVEPADFEPFVGMGENRYLGGVAEKNGIGLELESDKKYTYDRYLELIRGRLKPLPGIREFLSACRRNNLKCALATSADEVKMKGNLREIGLSDTDFDALVHGGEVTRRKPFPDLFQLAARRMALSAEDCLVVEDAPAGIIAAKAAGAEALGITSSFDAEALRDAGAAWVAANLEDGLRMFGKADKLKVRNECKKITGTRP